MTEGLINILSWNTIDSICIFFLWILNSVGKIYGAYWKKQKYKLKFAYED